MTHPAPGTARAAPVHAPMRGFPVTGGGDLLVSGMPLTRLAERVGSTPFYAYDRGLLRAALQQQLGLPARVALRVVRVHGVRQAGNRSDARAFLQNLK